jgi:LAO/AO transport system kinase
VAAKGEGLEEVVDTIEHHRAWMDERGELGRRRHARAAAEIEALAVVSLRAEMKDPHTGASLGALADEVVAGQCDPYAAADRLVEELRAS